jgi:iron(III) transport system substrate-binding protein
MVHSFDPSRGVERTTLMSSRRPRLRAVVAAAAGAAASLVLAACAPGAADRLVVYSNAVSDGRGDWLVAEAKEAGFEVTVVDLGGGDLKNRLIAERARPQADVVFGLNDAFFYQLVEEDVVQPYEPAWADEVDRAFGDREYFWPMYRFPILLVYDTGEWTAQTAPGDWPELWEDPTFQGQYETPSALGGMTSQTVIAGILSRHRDENPDALAGVAPEGWDAIDQYFQNGSRAVEGTDLFARIASGDVSMGQMWMHGRIPREEQFQVETRGVAPEIGVPTVVESIALVQGTPRADLAARFIDWFGSAEVAAAWSNEFYYVPVNERALPNADQDAIEEANSYDIQEIDWRWVAANLDEWIEITTLRYLR